MSHNPTYDPEPGYEVPANNPYGEGDIDRSGRSTPNYNSHSAPVDSYSNMASYRQATTAPPQSDPAGNGKSYRYATEATIPEDEDEADHVPEYSKQQVQFTERGNAGSIKGKDGRGFGSQGGGSNTKFKILIVVTIILALLWVIFMALFIKEKVNPSEDGNSPSAKTGESKDNPGGQGSSVTDSPTTIQATDPVPDPTTTPNPIPSDSIGQIGGKDVLRYTLINKNNVELELLSLGARVNKLRTGNKDIVLGFDTPTVANVTAIMEHMYGAVDGPICGQTANTMHQINYESTADAATGEVKFMTTVSDMQVTVTYSLSDTDQVMVELSAVSVGNAEPSVDLCSAMSFNLDDTEPVDVKGHRLMINANHYHSTGSDWIPVSKVFDLRTSQPLGTLIDTVLLTSDLPKITADFLLVGAPGLLKTAELQGQTTANKVTIQTNQETLKISIITDKDFDIQGKRNYKANSTIEMKTHNSFRAEVDQLLLIPGAIYKSVTVYTLS